MPTLACATWLVRIAMPDSFIQVVTTVGDAQVAQQIATALVEQRLAACVQTVGPVTSTYRWQGKIETAQEWQLVIKSHARVFPALRDAIAQLHPYDVPEILALPIVAGADAYLEWMQQQIQ